MEDAARGEGQVIALPTIWRVPDDLWALVRPVLAACDPPKRPGRQRIDPRAALDAIIFRLRSGCQWNRLPREFPDDSSVHRTFQRWVRAGVLARIWAVLVGQCAERGGVQWAWQAADAALGKARSGGDHVGRNPTDRGEAGVKRSVLAEAAGGPLSAVVAAANVHDTKLLAATLGAVIVPRPAPTSETPQHLCSAGVRRYPARRWVVERTLGWLSKCRALLVRYDKKAGNFLGLIQLACALLWYRRLQRLGGDSR